MVTNNNKRIKNNQAWLPCEPSPIVTSATSAVVAGGDGDIYYLNALTFYKYYATAKTYLKLQSPNLTPATRVSMDYSPKDGHRGNCLGATNNTITIAGLPNISFNDYVIRLTSGTGEGQERTITATGEAIVLDSGLATSATVNAITDTTKRWEINQYIGCSVRIPFGLGASQTRKVLYNDATTLYFFDANYQQLECWNNAPFSAIAPYVAPAGTAGAQTNYVIEQQVLTVDTNWTTNPDSSTSYCIESGGVFMFTSQATGLSALQYYDVLADFWMTKTPIGGLLTAQIGTDFTFEMIKHLDTPLISAGTITSATSINITVPTITPAYYENMLLIVTNPATGTKQRRRIVGNTATVIQVDTPFTTTPDNTYTYEITANEDTGYLIGNNQPVMFQYQREKDFWASGSVSYTGQCCNISATFGGQEPYGVSTIVRNVNGITALNATPTAGGTGYAVGDLFNITTGGTVGKGRVEAISVGGVVTAVSLYSAGLNYTTGAGKATTNISGTGTGLTVNITTVGAVGRVTTVANTNLYKGDTITIAGCNESAWNTSYTILAIDALTIFDITTTATLTAVATASQSTTVIVDASKSWGINELKYKMVLIQTAGLAPTTQLRKITSNIANAITVPTIVAGINGTSRYHICTPQAFGRDMQYKRPDKQNYGYATSGSTTTLVDTSKNWIPNQWINYKFFALSGAGYLLGEITIASNTATQLNFTAIGTAIDATTRYIIMDTFGIATAGSTTTLTDTTKNWQVNLFAGKYVLYTGGTGQRVCVPITSHTATVLTFATTTAPDTTTTYTILGAPNFSTGIELMHLWNSTVKRAKQLLSFRGGATNTAHKYCISCEVWDYTIFFAPQSEAINTGSYFVYNGGDKIYFSPAVASGATQMVFYIDLLTGKTMCVGAVPVTQLAPLLGNRMDILTDEEGTQWLYHMRNSGFEMFRCPLWL